MNFTPELSSFQGVLISADNVNQFSTITARGGNEEKLLDVVTRLYNFLQDRQYFETNLSEKLKTDLKMFTYYLILNSDLPCLDELVEMPGIDMVIWTVPTITKCLVTEIVWALNLDAYLYEVIAYCHPTLSLEVLQIFAESIKLSEPSECLTKLRALVAGCYKQICRFNFYNFDESFKSYMLHDLYELFLMSITYYVTPPKPDKLNNLELKYKYMGTNLIAMISLILECFNSFNSIEKFEAQGFSEMYACTFKPENIRTRELNHKTCESNDISILEWLQKCNTALLDKCMIRVMEVTINIFCLWNEHEFNGNNMQQYYGEMCYKLRSVVQEMEVVSDHPLLSILAPMCRKPRDINDVIKQSDTATIIEHINGNGDNKHLWVKALLQKDDLCTNVDIINCLKNNVQLIEEEDRNTLLKYFISLLKLNETLIEPLKLLTIKLMSICDSTQKEQVVSEHFTNNILNNLMQTSELESMATEILNKFTATLDADLSDIFLIYIQNPSYTYTKIAAMAIENIKQCDICLKLMRILQAYSNHYYDTEAEASITKSIQSYSQMKLETDIQRDNYVIFLRELNKSEILSSNKLLVLIIMPNLHKAIEDLNLDFITPQIKLLDQCIEGEELLKLRSPLLVMLAQVFNTVRCTLNTFSNNAATTLEVAIEYQTKLLDSFGETVPDKEISWIKTKIKYLSPLNMYYYRKLWNPPGDNFVEIVSGAEAMDANGLILVISKILPSATQHEWELVWESLQLHEDFKAIEIMYKVLTVLNVAVKKSKTESNWACILYCYRSIIIITKNKFLSDPPLQYQVDTMADKISDALNFHTENEIKDVGPIFLPVISYICSHNYLNFKMFKKNMLEIKHVEFRNMVTQLFEN